MGELQSQDWLLEVLVLDENGRAFVQQPCSFIGCDLSGEGCDLLWKVERDSAESQLATFLPVGQWVLSWRGCPSSTFSDLPHHTSQILQWGVPSVCKNLPYEPNKGVHWSIGLGTSSICQCNAIGIVLDQHFSTFFFFIIITHLLFHPKLFRHFFLIVPPTMKS